MHTQKDLLEYRSRNKKSEIFCLIGTPLTSSISDKTHNAFCRFIGLDAFYFKVQTTVEELPEILSYACTLPMQGLSVTMPLKEAIMPYLDEISIEAQQIGAVNTVAVQQGKCIGSNTDGRGCLNAIERELKVKNKHVYIIGSGGAAKAIAYEALRRGGLVTLLGRNKEKVFREAARLHCHAVTIDEISQASFRYDILINATPALMPIDASFILPETFAMDIHTKPMMTPFLQEALTRKCRLIYGYQMFVEQAVLQWITWHPELNPDLCRSILEQESFLNLNHSKVL